MATKKKKAVKKPMKKSVKKPAKKAVKKVIKKTVKKASKKKIAKKPAKKAPIKKVVQKAKPAPKVKATSKLQPAAQVDYGKAVTPLGDRLVVRVTVNTERVTPGGLIIPETVGSVAVGYLKAEVLAVGHGGKNKKGYIKPLDVKVGDTVLFAEYAGTKINFNSEELQIIHESDVMGIIQN